MLIKGIFEKERFLDSSATSSSLRTTAASSIKKMAGYHQFHAVNKAVESTLEASAVGATAAPA